MSGASRDPQAPEIRAWGRENGWEVEDAGRIPAALRSAWATATAGGAAPLRGTAANGNGHQDAGGVITFSVPDYVPPDVGAAPAYEDAEPIPEQPPAEPRRQSRREKIAERVEGFRNRRRPAPGKRRRVTLETLGGFAWAGAAQLCARHGRFLPVASIMAYQAPVAGMVLEDTLKNTVADTLLQPVARLVESGSTAGALIGPPALAGLVCVRPELYPVARPLMAMAMKEWVITAGPKLRELRRREELFQAEMAELGEEFGGIDVEEIIDLAFAPLFEQMQMAGAGAAPGAASNGHPAS